jgi:hypothetical protein
MGCYELHFIKMNIRFLTIGFTLLCLAAVNLNTARASTFPDTGSRHPQNIPIDFVSNSGIMGALEDGKFWSNEIMTRADAVTAIVKAAGLTVGSGAQSAFDDISGGESFAPYIAKALNQNILSGSENKTFYPQRSITRAEFIKMLLLANNFQTAAWGSKKLYNDIYTNRWFTPYMNYAGLSGIIKADLNNNLYPGNNISRGEIAEAIYIMDLIKHRTDNAYLATRADLYLAQSKTAIDNQNLITAKKASEMFVVITQQAYRNDSKNAQILSRAKVARSIDYLVNAELSKKFKNYSKSKEWSDLAVLKANEADQIDASANTKNETTNIKKIAAEL